MNTRNIGVIAHIDAGKTTLSERILFYTQKIHRMGEVHEGTATMDFMPEEQERGITIASACTTCHWNDSRINLIDTPGHVDFTIEVERSLRILDGAIGVFCAVGGVEPQSETVWRQSEKFGIPKLAFINKIDRNGADFSRVLEEMQTRLGTLPLPINIPAGEGEDFTGIIDLVTEEKYIFSSEDQGKTFARLPLSPEESILAQKWRDLLLERLAENDDIFLEQYLSGTYGSCDILSALRRVCLARKGTPTFCGSALRNTGVQPLLDAIEALLPAPEEVSPPMTWIHKDKPASLTVGIDAPLAALVFKVTQEHGQKIAFLRLYAGHLPSGSQCWNTNQQTQDRAIHIYRLHADRREPLEEAVAGDIVAVIGLRSAHTGETYCLKEHPVLLENIQSYAPVITLQLEPRNADEDSILLEALSRYIDEDPTLHLQTDEESGSRMLSGMGELHLDIILERMEREYKIRPRVGHQQVVLRETIQKSAKATGHFDKELGKERHIGEVSLTVSPLTRGEGNTILFGDFLPTSPQQAAQVLPVPAMQAVQEGLTDCLQSGILTGYPVQDINITIDDIPYQKNITTLPGLRMAAAQALRDAASQASPVALEPIMRVTITVPEAHLGAAISLFNTCGGRVENLTDSGGQKHMEGLAPLRQLFGFSTSLRSATQGRAGLIMTFQHFDAI